MEVKSKHRASAKTSSKIRLHPKEPKEHLTRRHELNENLSFDKVSFEGLRFVVLGLISDKCESKGVIHYDTIYSNFRAF